MQIEIDKKDAGLLIKEFMTASKEGRNEDALLVYEKIGRVYNRMPRKYKKKVYDKIIPCVKSITRDINN